MNECPYCGSTTGSYSKDRIRIDQYYDFDGEPAGYSEPSILAYRKRTMSRYIDADDLYVDWYDSFVADDGTEYDNVPLITKGQIDDAPSIDIVHCRECKHKHFETMMFKDGPQMICERPFVIGVVVNPDDFCSYGEREGE